jgi:3-oxoacyl-[acyl-carrier-protein] synthase-1
MRRVVVTGMGIVSCLGNDADTVSASLREGRSGITHQPAYASAGLRSHVAGVPQVDLESAIDRKLRRFMGDAAAYAYLATQQALADAALTAEQVRSERTGVIAGSGGASPHWQIAACARLARTWCRARCAPRSPRRWPPRSASAA